MSEDTFHLAEESKVSLPLKSLIGMVVVASIAVVTYTQAINRLTALERQVEIINVEVEENDTWIDEFEPPKEVQATVERVRQLEIQMAILKTELKQLQEK
jgi:hypothetical protein